MAIAPYPINPPVRVPLPRGRLLDIISEFDAPDDRWVMGVTWQPWPCEALLTMDVDVCSRIDFTDFPRQCQAAITQSAFSVYDALIGSTLEYTPEDIEEVLTANVTLKSSASFATELISGAVSGDRALSKSAHPTTLLSTASTIYNAMLAIENDLAFSLQGAQGMIHMPPGLLQEAVRMCGLRIGSDGQWETPLGNKVVADAGYIGARKPDFSATPGVQLTTAWVYGSGLVQYKMTAPMAVDGGNIGSTLTNFTGRENAAQSVFTSRNRMTRFVDRIGILIFDPCPVNAVLVNYTENA